MEPNPLRTTLDTLREERQGAESRLVLLQLEVAEAEMRLMYLRGAIENIEALLGEPPLEAESESQGASVREVDFTNTPDPAPRRKRVPSTDWVADVVRELDRPASRDEVYDAFVERRGIPESWNTNPRNSFNNALGRAVERGLVIKDDDDQYFPRDYNPFENKDPFKHGEP